MTDKTTATVVIKIVGRPYKTTVNDQHVTLWFKQKPADSLPKGLPEPSATTPAWRVFVAVKQWRKVEQAITGNSDDNLMVEGVPTGDSNGKLVVLATSVKSSTMKQ